MISKRCIFLFVLGTAVGLPCFAQRENPSYGRNVSRNRPRLYSPYFNQSARYAYQLNPYAASAYGAGAALPQATLPPVTGPVEKYSPVEYGHIVEMALEAAKRNNPVLDGRTTRPTIVEMTTASQEASQPTYKPASTAVSDILDRGIFLLPTGEEVRLRGVTIPSSTDKNDTNRLYAKEAIQVLRNLTQGKQVAVLLDDPLRDGSGRLLGTLLLNDGTELNRRMIELGYGTFTADDFGPTVDFSDMEAAQTEARNRRLGIWSANF